LDAVPTVVFAEGDLPASSRRVFEALGAGDRYVDELATADVAD
jgi:hypothetical protein